MSKVGDGGPFVLPPMPCSSRRQEFFRRNNRIMSTYATMIMYASTGQEADQAKFAANQINDDTPMRISLGEHVIQTSYRMIKSAFPKARGQLTNQAFLSVYGSFEAFLADLSQDAFSALGSQDPLQEVISLTATTKWDGKLDRIIQKFSLALGHRRYIEAYKNIDMKICGRATNDPIEALQTMADFRHRLVHSAGRVDAKLLSDYPALGLAQGDLLQLPAGFPFTIHFFLVPLTDVLDKAFCDKFNWDRPITPIEQLTDIDLRARV